MLLRTCRFKKSLNNPFIRNMHIIPIPVSNDNYSYLVVDEKSKKACAIDCADPDLVMQEAKKQGATITHVLTTHHHNDHCGGNDKMRDLCRTAIFVGGIGERIPQATVQVKHNDIIAVGGLTVKTLHTAGHTNHHMCYYVTDNNETTPAVFTGDILFLGGCGRLFEGNASQLHQSLMKTLYELPDTSRVYCGHEYSLQNLAFASTVEPNNPALQAKLSWAYERQKQRLSTIPSTIGEEKSYNPFMRVNCPGVIQFTGLSSNADPIEVMRIVREKKDSFKVPNQYRI